MPPTSIKHAAPADLATSRAGHSDSVDRARRRLREGHYDRPEVRRILAALILRRAARRSL